MKHTNYEGKPQFIIKIVYSCVVDIKIITPKYFFLQSNACKKKKKKNTTILSMSTTQE